MGSERPENCPVDVAELSSDLRSIEREQAPQCGVATIEIAEYGDRTSL